MKNLRTAVVAVACALALVIMPTAALGETVAAGNVLDAGESSSAATGAVTAQRDYCWFGQTFQANDVSVGSDLIAAGQSVSVRGGTIGGSVRAAGQNIDVTNVTVSDNITAAGETVMVGKGTTCAAAYLAGKQVEFDGTASDVRIAAQDVVIAGTVIGDVTIDAGSVTIGSGAVITGNLSVRAGSEPSIASDAKVESMDYVRTGSEVTESKPAFDFAGVAYLVFVFCLIALILTWIFPVAVDGAAAMVRQHPAAHLVTGLVGMVAAIPVALALLLVAPLAGAFVGVILAVFLVAAPFAGASATRVIVPGWSRFGAAALGGAVAGLLCSIPFVRGIFIAVAFVYLLGYVLQSIHRGMHAPTARELEEQEKGLPAPSAPSAPVPPAPGSSNHE